MGEGGEEYGSFFYGDRRTITQHKLLPHYWNLVTWSHHSLSLGNVVLAGQKYKQLVRLHDKIKTSQLN